ncbi:MAG: isopeptide-forming domain-containing fimbrial protein, partial [Candidatus Altarchaeaceae archaeon]
GANIDNDKISSIDNYLNISIGVISQGQEIFVEFDALINDSATEGANKNKIIAKGINEQKTVNSTSYTYLTIYKPEINVIKSSSKYFVGVGDEVEFTITIVNPTYANLYDIKVVDVLPIGFSYINNTSKLNGINISDPIKNIEQATETQRQNLTWNFSMLPAKSFKVLTYRAKVVHCNLSKEMFNEVNVSGIYKNGNQNITKSANTSVKIVGILSNATLIKYSNKDITSWFDVIEYTIVIKTNISGGNILPLNLTDVLPPYLKYINNSATIDGEVVNPIVVGDYTTGQNLTWYLNDSLLSPGTKLTIKYRAMTYPGINKTFKNTATLKYVDPVSGENLMYEDNANSGTIPQLPDLNEINKTIEKFNEENKLPRVSGINRGIATSDECINANVIHLKKGWNLISLPTQPINNSIDYVLAPIKDKYTDVFTYDNGWIYRSKYMNKWFGNLNEMDIGKGYWIKVTEDCNLTIIGYYIDNWKIELKKGWNLVGVVGCGSININNLSFTDQSNNTVEYTDIFTYDNQWIYKSKYMDKWFGSLNTIEPGKGYWIKVKNDCNVSIS